LFFISFSSSQHPRKPILGEVISGLSGLYLPSINGDIIYTGKFSPAKKILPKKIFYKKFSYFKKHPLENFFIKKFSLVKLEGYVKIMRGY